MCPQTSHFAPKSQGVDKSVEAHLCSLYLRNPSSDGIILRGDREVKTPSEEGRNMGDISRPHLKLPMLCTLNERCPSGGVYRAEKQFVYHWLSCTPQGGTLSLKGGEPFYNLSYMCSSHQTQA